MDVKDSLRRLLYEAVPKSTQHTFFQKSVVILQTTIDQLVIKKEFNFSLIKIMVMLSSQRIVGPGQQRGDHFTEPA